MTKGKTTKRPTLGVVAISRNEEKDLPAFIENLESWVDEIIVVDDGSTDETTNILRKAGPKVKLLEQLMDPEYGFAGQRNRGIKEVSSDWLLHMDIDERVPAPLASEIIAAIQSDRYDAYRYRRLNFFLHRPMKAGGFQDWNNPQLARKGRHHFENAVHETCVVQGAPGSIGQLNKAMWHLNDESYKERMGKSFLYCQEQAKRLSARVQKIQWWHLAVLPVAEFIKKFLLRKGYRDGVLGLLWGLHCSCAMFRACALVWDEQNSLDREEIEQQLRENWRQNSVLSKNSSEDVED